MSPRRGRMLTIASTSDPEEDEDVIPGNKDAVVVAEGDGDGETREDKAENSLVDFDAGECTIIGPDPPLSLRAAWESGQKAAPKTTPSIL